MTLLIPPRERTASRASSRATRAVIMALTAAGNRLHERCQVLHPFLKSGAARIDGAADDLVVEHEVTHDPFGIDLDRRHVLPGHR